MNETQVWSGKVYGGDKVVVRLNAAAEDIELSVTRRNLPPTNWQVAACPKKLVGLRLWGNRMDEAVAQQILDNPEITLKIFQGIDWYSSTVLP